MTREIVCQKGRCFDFEAIEHELDSLFNRTNIVEQIELDLLKNRLHGT
ncbi:hypothetical protein HYU07_02915 [Candidatus Woesearchaeota archaeon]|nr:hypothetical protein [Candidatus Woesearchaeota archaeon]